MIVGQGPTALVVGPSGGCLDSFTLLYLFSSISLSLSLSLGDGPMWTEILSKGLLNPKQPTNQSSLFTGNRHNIYEITELHFNIPSTFVVLPERTLLL